MYKYIVDSFDEVILRLQNTDTFTLDIETTGLNPHDSRILLCQVSPNPEEQYVFNAETVDLKPLIPFINSWKWKKVIQNVKFEAQFLEHFYGTRMVNVWDTQLADRICYQDVYSNSLESIADRYLGKKLNKKVRDSFFKLNNHGQYSEKQIMYAAEDVEILWPVMEHQKERLAEIGQEHIAELEFNLAPVVGHMELVGIPIDAAKWRNILTEYRALHEQSRLKMNALIFDTGKLDEQLGLFERDGINLGSHPKILKAFNDLGIDINKTDNRTISLINHPLAKELLNYRKLDKIFTSYGKTFLDAIHPFTSRIHPSFQQIGADTGRFSCREPNMQQVPEKFRVCVGNAEDYLIVGADYSQMELRIIAELSEDERLIDAFLKGYDVHKATASLMFGVSIDNVTKEQRFAAKTINFGIAYGMGVKKLKDSINTENAKNGIKKQVTFADANFLKEKHRQAYPRVRAWLEQNGEDAYRKGVSVTLYNRKRFYPAPDRSLLSEEDFNNQVASIKRQGANSPIQGTNADITKFAMINLHNELQDYGLRADIINQVHDEIVLLAHKSQVEEVKRLVIDSMVKSGEQLIHKVPVKVDVYASEIWAK